MNDQRAHFLLMFDDVCAAARLADLAVTVALSDGTNLNGGPTLIHQRGGDADLDELDDRRQLMIAGQQVTLADVVGFAVHFPSAIPAPTPDTRQPRSLRLTDPA